MYLNLRGTSRFSTALRYIGVSFGRLPAAKTCSARVKESRHCDSGEFPLPIRDGVVNI